MFTVGLTGGIGAGKSAVADLLVEHGAVLIDADRIAREVVEPGGPAYQPLVDRFGPAIVDAEARIDRPALAAVVFSDAEALADLNAITHPAIGAEMARRQDAAADTDAVVVLDIPLLKAEHRETMSLDAVVVVDTPVDMALARLVEIRGMTREDAEARMAAQVSRDERLSGADFVVDNSKDLVHLGNEVERVWQGLSALRQKDTSPAP
ncbi:MAG TPA: dephospho-CoA kinase [Acidimicrobiales bacterium]|jgi:dephospho-CoA kinase|nr:dephospho-CoA kinase [Acidimicrobiales bacterium]